MAFPRIASIIFSSTLLATGAFAESSVTPTYNFSGFSVGLGVGYTHGITNDDTTVTIYSVDQASAEYARDENISNGLSPILSAGYHFYINDRWLLGFEGTYKYTGIQKFNQFWSGTFTNGTFQQANLYTKFNHEGLLLFNAAYEFQQWLVYIGAGASLMTLGTTMRGDQLLSTSTTFTHTDIKTSKTLWGGAAQAGFEYMLPDRFSVQMFYSFAISATSNLPSVRFQSGSAGYYSEFKQKVQLIDQSIAITINKYF